jgi:hypothetical protein
MDEPALRESRRPRIVRVIAVSVASLLMANGVILAEHYSHTDLASLLADGVRDARSALARALDPEEADKVQAAVEKTTTTTTAAGPATTATTAPAATTDTTAPAAAAGPGPAPKAPPVTAPPAAAVPAANTIEQAVPTLSAFVEKERGLKFKSPVTLRVLEDGPFKTSLAERRMAPAEAEARQSQGVMRALGLIDPGVDLAAQVKRLSTGSATAFYDAGANELVVKAGPVTPFTRKILVHELTNALSDQHFELDRPALRGNEAGHAFEAIAQGVAARVGERFVATLSAAERQAVEAEQRRLAALIPRDIPQYVLVSFGFPFTAGLRLANALASAGGQGRLNTALQGPPVSSEQVLRPEKFAAGEAPKAIAAPAADGPVVSQGSLGQLNLSLMLAEVLEAGYAEGAADGWGGDSYVAWQNGAQTCVRMAIDMDSAEENTELAEALVDWAAERPGAVVEGIGPFTVTRCA